MNIEERLLTLDQAAARLGTTKRTVYRHMARLRAKGLQFVKMNRMIRVRAHTLNKLIKRAAEREEPIF